MPGGRRRAAPVGCLASTTRPTPRRGRQTPRSSYLGGAETLVPEWSRTGTPDRRLCVQAQPRVSFCPNCRNRSRRLPLTGEEICRRTSLSTGPGVPPGASAVTLTSGLARRVQFCRDHHFGHARTTRVLCCTGHVIPRQRTAAPFGPLEPTDRPDEL